MNWRSFLSRILLVAVTFPLLAAIIVLLPHFNHLGFNIVVVAVTVLGAFETQALFAGRKIATSRWIAPLLAGTLPAVAYLEVAGIAPGGFQLLWVAAVLAAVLVRAIVFQRAKTLPDLLAFVSSSIFVLLYPGFFLAYIVRISSLPYSAAGILFFLCIIFGNDMAAYFAGSMWGSSTRLNLPVSPQKSAVGFAAGLAGSLIVVVIFHFAAPKALPFGLPTRLLIGAVLGIATMLGDLVESGLKRSAGTKDSGIIVPGRGGMLDSVDSMVLSAPLFFYIFSLGSG